MKEFENEYFIYNQEMKKLKFYSDEFDRLIERCGLKLDRIELNVDSGDIYCYLDKLNFKEISCSKFENLLKDRISIIQDVILKEDFFILVFNVEIVELS